MSRLTDEQILDYGRQARRILEFARGDVPVGTVGVPAAALRDLCAEVYARRAAELTSEDVKALRRLRRSFWRDDDERLEGIDLDPKHWPEVLEALDKLLEANRED